MKNPIARTAAKLMPAASAALGGLTEHAESLRLSYVSPDAMTTVLAELVLASNKYKQAQHDLKARMAETNSIIETARSFGVIARDILKLSLGSRYSQAWNVAGFMGTLMLPHRVDDLIPLFVALGGHLTAHPERENAPLNVTAARATALKGELIVKKNALTQQEAEADRLLSERNDKAKAVYNKLRTLFKELSMVLDPLDSRWVEFGFNKPGAAETPESPENVTAELIDNTRAVVKWGNAPRAEYFRVWSKVDGVDPDWVALGSVTNGDLLVERLPANSLVHFAISAVNNGGESNRSASITVRTP